MKQEISFTLYKILTETRAVNIKVVKLILIISVSFCIFHLFIKVKTVKLKFALTRLCNYFVVLLLLTLHFGLSENL